MESKLTFNAQVEVDNAIQEAGLAAIGYYSVNTTCTNCGKDGFAVFRYSCPAKFEDCFCVKCGCSTVKGRGKEILEGGK